MSAVWLAYRRGAAIKGWACSHCHVEYPHNGRPGTTYALFVLHKVATHRRLPRVAPWVTVRRTSPNTYELAWTYWTKGVNR